MTPPINPRPDAPVATAARWNESALARCKGCRWERPPVAGASWLAVRAAARRHVRATGHHVWATVATSYAYRLADVAADRP